MKITAINPFTHIYEKHDESKFYLSFNMQDNLSEGISKLVKYKKPVFIMPSPNFYWDSDFMSYEQTINNAIKNSNIYLMDNQTKILTDEKNNKKYRLLGGVFWNDYEGLNEELVTLSLIKSPHFQKIKANVWLDNHNNLNKFFEINENLKKSNIYYKIYKQYYKIGNFHPIISYLLYHDNLTYITNEIKKPFNGENIIMTHNQPTSFGIYLNGNQINSNSLKLNTALSIHNNIENFISKKTSLEFFLENEKVQHLIHGNSGRHICYKFNRTNINGINLKNIPIDLNNSSISIKETLSFLLDENQKFVDIIRNSMINQKIIIETTNDFIDFIKLYSFAFSILQNDFFSQISDNFGQKIAFIDPKELTITQKEINTNVILNIEEKMKYMLSIISKNHFSLQKLINSIN